MSGIHEFLKVPGSVTVWLPKDVGVSVFRIPHEQMIETCGIAPRQFWVMLMNDVFDGVGNLGRDGMADLELRGDVYSPRFLWTS